MSDRFELGDGEFLLQTSSGKLYLAGPVCGGMADSVPREPEQLAWAEREFAARPWLVQVWATTWAVPADRLADLTAFFAKATR